ncbi:MAG: type II toxin-antitoxin system RelE/ParE family toxin [Hyphomonadaceae bacterium]
MLSIVELATFLTDTDGVLEEGEREQLKIYLAANPEAGVVIRGTGGVRKLRWAASGRGKRGGGRVIYYFHDTEMPLYLFKFFTKASETDLSQKEKKELSAIIASIVTEHKKRK